VVVDVTDDINATTQAWMREIEFVFRDVSAANARADALRQAYKERYSWRSAAALIAGAIRQRQGANTTAAA